MALSHAILVSLLERPQSGYDLAKRFDQTVGYFWKASHQQIYLELHKLAQAGLVESEKVEQATRPNRIVYAITDAGGDAIDAWIAEPTESPSFKEELLVKLFALGKADAGVLLAELEQRLAFHRERLAQYEALMQQHYPRPEQLVARKRGHYLGLRMGVLIERGIVQWCEEARAMVADLRRGRATTSTKTAPTTKTAGTRRSTRA